MIVEAILVGVLGALTTLLETIPDATLPVGTYPAQFAEAIGGALGGLDGFLPISEMAVVVGWVLATYVPVVLTYHLVLWIYTHLPVIGNGG